MSESSEHYFDAPGSSDHFDPPGSPDLAQPVRTTRGGQRQSAIELTESGGRRDEICQGSGIIPHVAQQAAEAQVSNCLPVFDCGILHSIATICGPVCTVTEIFSTAAGPQNEQGMELFRLGSNSFVISLGVLVLGSFAYRFAPHGRRWIVLILVVFLTSLWMSYSVMSWRLSYSRRSDTRSQCLRSMWVYGIVALLLLTAVVIATYVFIIL